MRVMRSNSVLYPPKLPTVHINVEAQIRGVQRVNTYLSIPERKQFNPINSSNCMNSYAHDVYGTL